MADGAMVRKRGRQRQARRMWGAERGVWNAQAPSLHALRSTLRVHVGWMHLVSLLLLATCIGLMVMIARGDEYYVIAPQVIGAQYVSVEEVTEAAAVNGLHIFWIDPAQIEAAVRNVPNVADAKVSAAWPNRVTIEVAERDPVFVWVEGETVRWADASGRLMPVRSYGEGLLTVISEASDQGVISDMEKLPEDLVTGALQLHTLVPQATELRYTQAGGLAFDDARGWTAYFGVGADMAQKLAIYNALVASVEARGLKPLALVVDDVRHPYYRLPPPTPTPGP